MVPLRAQVIAQDERRRLILIVVEEFFAHKSSLGSENPELREILARDFSSISDVEFTPIPHLLPPIFSKLLCIATVVGVDATVVDVAIVGRERDRTWMAMQVRENVAKFYVARLDRRTDMMKVRVENSELEEPLNAAINRDFSSVKRVHYARFF